MHVRIVCWYAGAKSLYVVVETIIGDHECAVPISVAENISVDQL